MEALDVEALAATSRACRRASIVGDSSALT